MHCENDALELIREVEESKPRSLAQGIFDIFLTLLLG